MFGHMQHDSNQIWLMQSSQANVAQLCCKHQFEELSIMNYQQMQYRIYPKTHIDDVDGITSCFENDGINNSLTDVSVSAQPYHPQRKQFESLILSMLP